MNKSIYRTIVDTPDFFTYNIKFSKEGNKIALSVPNSSCLIDKNSKILDPDFEMTLRIMGWTDVAIRSFMTKILFPTNGRWRNCLTINASTGKITNAY